MHRNVLLLHCIIRGGNFDLDIFVHILQDFKKCQDPLLQVIRSLTDWSKWSFLIVFIFLILHPQPLTETIRPKRCH